MTTEPHDPGRPDPDKLLEQIRTEDTKARRGRLKIFLGMCPGVGKTYSMLQAARKKQRDGVEVVVGIVETHGRDETAALIEGLPVVPRLEVEYRGTAFGELDIEAILLWKPGLVVVDELAHTNAPGSRHPKRYQDVLELLDGGVDVFTTVNVQHIESRSESVRRIAGIPVRETVPDTVLDAADELELVDVTPEQLRQRLKEGKVYLGERAVAAAENFFRDSNLAALREMALRLTAENVERSSRMAGDTRTGWRGGDLLVVGVSASPHSAQLLRWARRYAAGLEVPWIAVAVETPRPLPVADERRRTANLGLARELGAEVVLAGGTSVAETLVRVAREKHATHIILGKPNGPAWKWFFRSPVAWTIENSGVMDIQLIRTEDTSAPPPKRERTMSPDRWKNNLIVLGLVAAVTGIGFWILDPIGYWAVALLYLLVVTVAGSTLPRRQTLALATLSALAWNYLFIPPRFTFFINQPPDVLMFFMFFVVALVVGHLTSRLREREQLESRREKRALALYELARKFAHAGTLEEAVRTLCEQVHEGFGLQTAVFLRDVGGRFSLDAHEGSTWRLPASEEAVSQWVFSNQRPAGRNTDTLPEASGLHLPLLAGDHTEGVLAVNLQGEELLTPEQRELLETFAAQFAVVAAKERGIHAQQRSSVVAEAAKLQQTLFDSVSHELKIPVAAIQATLEQPQPDLGELRQAANRLRRTVGQLLDATRIESGLLQPVLEWCDPSDLVADALRLCEGAEERVTVKKTAPLPDVRVDGGLISQALAILIHNALTHGVSKEKPGVLIRESSGSVEFQISDRGPGLPSDREIFSKFVRGSDAPAGGIGLGLPIARHLAEIHGGSLEATDRTNGGAVFTLRIPTGGTMKLPE